MGKNSSIQWTQNSWNPWTSCKKISPGCKFCYMYRDKERYGQDPTTVLKSKTNFNAPLKWEEPKLIFTCSWSDWFIEEADEWRDEAWKIIKATPQHTYQILTKRPERIREHLPADWGEGYNNVWLGVSVENNKFLSRCEILGEIPAKVRFISAEPLIGEITDLNRIFSKYEYHWCIIGAESGNETGNYRYRECEVNWIKDIMKDCRIHGVKIFVKQLGTFLSKQLELTDRHGGEIDEWEKALQVRQFPSGFKKL